MTDKIDKLFLLLVCLITLILYMLTSLTINEFNVTYSLFSLVSLISITISIYLKNLSTLIFNTLLYLGFFFKISIIITIEQNYGKDIFFEEALTIINFNSDIFKSILTKLIFFYIFFSICEIIYTKSFKICLTKKDELKKNQLEKFILNNKKYLIISVLIFVILINTINLLFGITYRGKVFEFGFIELIFKTLNFFLSLSIICIIADIDFKKANKYSIIILILLIFSSIFNHFTLLSRSGIFELITILYIVSKTEFKKGIILLALSTIIWAVSVKQVNENRANKNISLNADILEKELNQSKEKTILKTQFEEVNNSETTSDDKKAIKNTLIFEDEIISENLVQKIKSNNFYYLMTYRWVGIDGIINVELKDDRNLLTFINALKEEYTIGDPTYYEKEFFRIPDKSSYNQVFIPGFLAFFNYSNIDTLFYLSAIFVAFLLLSFEYLILKLFYEYNLFRGLISYIVAWRIIHFGISPINTLNYFILILLTIISIKILIVIFENIYKEDYQ